MCNFLNLSVRWFIMKKDNRQFYDVKIGSPIKGLAEIISVNSFFVLIITGML